MRSKGLDALLIIDMADITRDPNLLFLSRHSRDAALIVLNLGERILFPLDTSLAKKRAVVDSIADMRAINNKWTQAVGEFFKERFPKKKPVVGFTNNISKTICQERSIFSYIEIHEDVDEIASFLAVLRGTQ